MIKEKNQGGRIWLLVLASIRVHSRFKQNETANERDPP